MLAELAVQLHQATQLLAQSSRICILTGAGISAESGIPTFRDKQTGLWEQYRAEDLASPSAFTKDPQLVWSWYQWRRQLVQDKVPNPAHIALAQWQQAQAQQLTLITQNVDDLHEQALSQQPAKHSYQSSTAVTHLHGHLWRNRCSQCAAPYNPQSQSTETAKSPNATIRYSNELLTCSHCGGYIRPDIVWFGESLPAESWRIAEQAAANCEVFISIGTSSLVYPAAGLAQLAKQNGAKIIEINPNPTPNTLVDITLAQKAGVVLPLLVQELIK